MSVDSVTQVTRALRMLLHSELTRVSAGAVVTLLPPGDQLPDVSGINLYLYRVMESPFTRNRPWPGNASTPPSDEPALCLQLFYLLTPLSRRPDDANFQAGDDAHTMLGAAMLTLQRFPILNDVHLPGFDADDVLPASLRDSFEQVKVCLQPTSLEEVSKIWASINRPYRLSVAYEVSMVELTPALPPPVHGGIVTQPPHVDVRPLQPPHLEALAPAAGALVRVAGPGLAVTATQFTVTPNDLRIAGFGFRLPGTTPVVRVGGQPVAVKGAPAPTDQSLTITLPADLDAGPDVDIRMTLGGRASAPLTFQVRPWLTSLTPVRTALDVPGATVALTGSGFTAPQAVFFQGPASRISTAFGAGPTDTHVTAVIPADLPNGIYMVRLVLSGGADSATNARTLEVLPLVSSPVGVARVTDAGGHQVHRLTLNGARLNGADVHLVIDGVTYQLGSNANALQITYTLKRLLATGTHHVAAVVDGHTSHTLDLVVPA